MRPSSRFSRFALFACLAISYAWVPVHARPLASDTGRALELERALGARAATPLSAGERDPRPSEVGDDGPSRRDAGGDANWRVVLEEGFEGAFPSGNAWRTYVNPEGPPYRWEEEAYLPRTGNHSGWCVGWSEDSNRYRQLDPTRDNYPEDVVSWMIWGPFDPSDAEEAAVDFWIWMDAAPGDSVFYGAGLDPFNFRGLFRSQRAAFYRQESFDVGSALGLADFADVDSIFVAFVFFSDRDPATGRGIFLDDIVVRKRVPGPICNLSADRLDFGAVPVDSTSEATVTIENLGDRDLVGTIALDCADFSLEGPPGIRVLPSSSVERRIRFHPTEEGSATCDITIAGSACPPIVCEGEGIVFRLPELAHTVPSPVAPGQSIELALDLMGAGPPGAPSATLRYLRPGENGPQWAAATMDANGANRFVAAIPAASVDLFGSAYYFEFEQGGLRATLPAEAPANVFPLRVQATSARLPGALPGGGEQSGYRMVSIPGEVAERGAAAVLVDDLGAYDDTVWRFFRYTGGEYLEFPAAPASQLVPGRAYWILHRETGRTFDVGAIGSWPLAPFEIELEPGWNDVASPFAAPLPPGAFQIVAGAADGPYAYEGAWRPPASVGPIRPWVGYSFFNPGSVPARLRLDPVPAPGGREAVEPEMLWSVAWNATSFEARDLDNRIGIARGATLSKDRLDFIEPRPIGDAVRLAFHAPEESGSLWCSDIRGLDGDGVARTLGSAALGTALDVATRDATVGRTSYPSTSEARDDGALWKWEIVVDSWTRGPVTIEWTPAGEVPGNGWALALDRVTGAIYDLGAPGRAVLTDVDLRVPGKRGAARLEVWAGDPRAVEERVRSRPGVAQVRMLGPNPFHTSTALELALPAPARVRARVFDAAGREVSLLRDDELPRGVHRLVWEGADRGGRPAPNGVYFWRVDVDAGAQGGRSFHERVISVR